MRGNNKIIQELEGCSRCRLERDQGDLGEVIWDPLLARDKMVFA